MKLINIYEFCNLSNKDEIGYKFIAKDDGIVFVLIKTRECGSYSLYSDNDNQSIFLGEDQLALLSVSCQKDSEVVFSSNKVPREFQIYMVMS